MASPDLDLCQADWMTARERNLRFMGTIGNYFLGIFQVRRIYNQEWIGRCAKRHPTGPRILATSLSSVRMFPWQNRRSLKSTSSTLETCFLLSSQSYWLCCSISTHSHIPPFSSSFISFVSVFLHVNMFQSLCVFLPLVSLSHLLWSSNRAFIQHWPNFYSKVQTQYWLSMFVQHWLIL